MRCWDLHASMMFTEALPRTEVFPVPLCCWFVDANLEGSQRGALHSHDRIVEFLAMRGAGDGAGLVGIPLPEQFRSGLQPHGAMPTSTLRKSARRLGAPFDSRLLI
jgi:hypothetical protein